MTKTRAACAAGFLAAAMLLVGGPAHAQLPGLGGGGGLLGGGLGPSLPVSPPPIEREPLLDRATPPVRPEIPRAVAPAARGVGETVNGALADPGTVNVAPAVDGVGGTISATGDAVQDAAQAAVNALGGAVQAVNDVGRLPDPAAFDVDTQGNRIVRNEVLALTPTPQALALAQNLNFTVLQDNAVGILGRLLILQAPPGMNATQALDALRQADPNGTYELNHVYDPSGEAPIPASIRREEATALAPMRPDVAVGLVEAGVDRTHNDLAKANIISANFASEGESVPSAHGTAIASLMVGSGGVNGALPGATLYAADVFGGQSDGGAADAVIRGLVWVSEQGAAVINVSLVGPPNALLEAAVKALTAKGHVIVAAVGNDGPAQKVNYPAAYPGVIAVTSVDRQHNIQIDANRGREIMFAAYGVDVRVATVNNSYGRATGTSFAAPLIAARIAGAMARPDTRLAGRVARSLQNEAVDLGARGRDPVFGYGFVESVPSTTTASR